MEVTNAQLHHHLHSVVFNYAPELYMYAEAGSLYGDENLDCSVRVSKDGYQRFEGTCYPHLQGRFLRNYTMSEDIRPLSKLSASRLQ